MENTTSNNESATPENTSKNSNVKIIVIAAILLFPILFLIFKSVNKTDNAAVAPNVDVQQQILAMEQQAAAAPTISNLTRLSLGYLNNKMPGKSIPVILRAIAIDSNNFVCHSNLGLAYTMIGSYAKGVDACNKALSLDTSSRLVKNNLKWAMDELKKSQEELSKMEATPESERNVGYFVKKGLIYSNNLNDLTNSNVVYNEGLTKFKDSPDLMNNLGVNYINMQRYDDAVVILAKAALSGVQLYKNNLKWALDEQKKAKELSGIGPVTAK